MGNSITHVDNIQMTNTKILLLFIYLYSRFMSSAIEDESCMWCKYKGTPKAKTYVTKRKPRSLMLIVRGFYSA